MKKSAPPLTLTDLLRQSVPDQSTAADPASLTSLLGGQEGIQQRTQFMRTKAETPGSSGAAAPPDEPVPDTSSIPPEEADTSRLPPSGREPPSRNSSQRETDKVTRSVQFQKATYRQMETTLNYIAYKSGRRNVSLPRYFQMLHELARQDPNLMNEIITRFKLD
jgi:hypothetical protein